jgi:hypothetical protein
MEGEVAVERGSGVLGHPSGTAVLQEAIGNTPADGWLGEVITIL